MQFGVLLTNFPLTPMSVLPHGKYKKHFINTTVTLQMFQAYNPKL